MEFKILKGAAVFGVNLFRGRLMGKDWEAEVKVIKTAILLL